MTADLNKCWNIVNRRRADLITKKYNEGLTVEERKELDKLQKITASIDRMVEYANSE